jgi:hypothetical protein
VTTGAGQRGIDLDQRFFAFPTAINDSSERTERKKPTEDVQAGDPDAAENSAVLSLDNIETRDEFLVKLAIIMLLGALNYKTNGRRRMRSKFGSAVNSS